METRTYSLSLCRQYVCRLPAEVPQGVGLSLGLQHLTNKIEAMALPELPPMEMSRPFGALEAGAGRPEDYAAYEGVYPEESILQKLFFNVGAGAFAHPYWTNVDRIQERTGGEGPVAGASLNLDLLVTPRLPIADETAELVYSAHLLEHLPDDRAHRLLREAFRILKPGGLLRVSTPDILLEYRAFKERDWSYFAWQHYHSEAGRTSQLFSRPMPKASIQQLFLYRFASHVSTLHIGSTAERLTDEKVDELFTRLPLCEALDYCTSRCDPDLQLKYPGNHISWWSFPKMRVALLDAGFRKVYLSGYGQSFAPPMRNTKLFDRLFPGMSLFVEARKGT